MILPGYRHQHSENNGKCCENHQRELAKLRQREESKVSELLSECEESAALAKIDEMFLTGIVSAANADYWNEKLSAARERHELAEQRYKELISALEPLENQEKLSAILKTVSNWAQLIESSPDDNILKRNLILSMVRQVRCIDKGKFEVDLVFASKKGKKIDITPVGVMSNGVDWWRLTLGETENLCSALLYRDRSGGEKCWFLQGNACQGNSSKLQSLTAGVCRTFTGMQS